MPDDSQQRESDKPGGKVTPPPHAEVGAYRIWVLDKNGKLINPPTKEKPNAYPDPSHPDACEIYFGLNDPPARRPTKEEIDLQLEISKVLRVAQRLYLDAGPKQLEKFKIYFVRLFRLAQLGLEGPDAATEISRSALKAIATDLIDDEAGRIKNGHLAKLGRYVSLYCLPCVAIYVLLRIFPAAPFADSLERLRIEPTMLSNFMLLWVGCFFGVWLSYGIRTTTFTLTDLVTTDSDRLAPQIRLLFSGLLAMILGLLFFLGIVEVKVGAYSVTAIASEPTLAFLVGLFCGISELSLPTSVGRKASNFINTIG